MSKSEQKVSSVYEFSVKDIDDKMVSLSAYRGKVLLIVNVASKCGFTKQYEGLEALYEKYKTKGFFVLGFPCNQFGGQEPGTAKEIKEFCELTYKVKFPMFAKIEVNGANTDPLYSYLKTEAKGILGTTDIKWNFTKFLVDGNGKVTKRYAPIDEPKSIAKDIEALLI